MAQKVLIAGSGGSGLVAAKIAEQQMKGIAATVVVIDEAKHIESTQTAEIQKLPSTIDRSVFKPPPTRAERRKQRRRRK